MKSLLTALLCFSALGMAQQTLPPAPASPKPTATDSPQTAEDPCSKQNIFSNMDIGTSLLKLYGPKKPEEIQFDKTIYDWAESTESLWPCAGPDHPYTQGVYQVKLEALIIERAFLLSLLSKLDKENQGLRAELQNSATRQAAADTQAAARQEARQRDNLILGIYLLGLRRPAYRPYEIPMPQQSRPGLHCTTNYIGTFAYTDCQ